MRLILLLFTCFFTPSFVASVDYKPKPFSGNERFIASTPANKQIKAFLNIPLADSVDFIRWDITFEDNQYQLSCSYGLSKPNTKDFIKGGHQVEIKDSWTESGSDRILKNGSKSIKLKNLNPTLLHFVDESENFMRGNGGWSYTLNRQDSEQAEHSWAGKSSNLLQDSIKYEGRTPSGIPGVPNEPVYHKLKWQIVFYADLRTNTPTTYRAISAPWRSRGGKKGTWKIRTDARGGITYHLLNEDNTLFVSLWRADDNVLLFSDGKGRLLIGNEDFSYTLNRYP